MTLGDQIQANRRQCGLSQEQLAERLGVSRQAVSKWELGDAMPDVDKVLLLADTFGISTDELLGRACACVPPQEEGESTTEMPSPRGGLRWYWLGYVLIVVGVILLLKAVLSGITLYQMLHSIDSMIGGLR